MKNFVLGKVCLLGVLLLVINVHAETWPAWRGNAQNGVAASGHYPVDFAKDKGVLWQVALPGRGASTPVVWGTQLWLTASIDGEDGLLCYGLDGRLRWQATLGKEDPGKHNQGTGANSSAATDGKYVIASFKSGHLACFTVEGDKLWQKNLKQDFPKGTMYWDAGTSPLIHNGRAIVVVMHTGDSYIAAFNLASGEVEWQVDRKFAVPEENSEAYCTPLTATIEGRDVLVVWGADHLTGHDLSSGERLWTCGGFNPDNKQYWRVIASPVIHGDMAIVPYGRGNFLAGIRLGGKGDTTATHRIWETRGISSDVPTPAARDGHAYVLTDRGLIAAVSVKNGEVLQQLKLPDGHGVFYASPVLAGDTLYCVRDKGTVYVLNISKTGFALMHVNEMGEGMVASPVPINGKLLLRGYEHLYCIGE
ncbi:MAG: PQQ-binding-like beta-propeller repeat protein [Verrucomicrobia bacterium]|nr:PQQ-binding-like beta-propeller repeat protein [Verrucomicrobiota bacterium]